MWKWFAFFHKHRFRIVKTLRELEDALGCSLKAISEAYKFLFDKLFSNEHPNNSSPVAINLVTILNNTFKYLAKGASKIPILALDTLEKIFEMDCREFDTPNGEHVILFRPVEPDSIDEEWIEQITGTFNDLLENRENWMQSRLEYPNPWPFAMAILAVVCSLRFLQSLYMQEKDNPLTDEQKQNYAQHLRRLKNILINICQNLTDKQIANFRDNLGVLRGILSDFETFTNKTNDSLEAKIKALEKEKEKKEIVTGVATIATLASIVTTFALWKSLSPRERVIGGVVDGALAGASLYYASEVIILHKIIHEHECTHKTVKSLKKLLGETRTEANGIDFDEINGQLSIWLDQFEDFRDKIAKFENELQ